MEWVETTGRTVNEALEAALDQLGVDLDDMEYQILEEPKPGLFGRLRSEARVRARVMPTKPRAKDDRRRRKPRDEEAETVSGEAGEDREVSPAGAAGPGDGPAADAETPAPKAARTSRRPDRAARTEAGRPETLAAVAKGNPVGQSPATESAASESPSRESSAFEPSGAAADVAEVATRFLEGLIEAFGVRATTEVHSIDDHTIEVEVLGPELGLLIGPKGQTLLAIQDLTRTVVHLEIGERPVRLMFEVAGYRRRRKVALEAFARQVAAQVGASGDHRYLEPMAAADRKIVHDTVNDIAGVRTVSEGEEPHRYVVVMPDGD